MSRAILLSEVVDVLRRAFACDVKSRRCPMSDFDVRREAAKTWLAAHPVEFRPGFYLDGEIDIDHRGEWCDVHARRAARLLTRLWRQRPDEPSATALECWSGDEEVRYCRTCGAPLDTGGIVAPGRAVENLAQEILEGEDRHLRGFIPELTAYADSMDDDNPAWPLLCDLIERAAKVVSGV